MKKNTETINKYALEVLDELLAMENGELLSCLEKRASKESYQDYADIGLCESLHHVGYAANNNDLVFHHSYQQSRNTYGQEGFDHSLLVTSHQITIGPILKFSSEPPIAGYLESGWGGAQFNSLHLPPMDPLALNEFVSALRSVDSTEGADYGIFFGEQPCQLAA
jgi:hypothetical protein